MPSNLTISSWVTIHEGCPMSCDVIGSAETYFLCGSSSDGFEFHFEAEALREFLKLGSKALADMDTLYEQEETARDAAERNELVTAGEQST